MTLDELDAARPRLDDGNFMLELLRTGDRAGATAEADRLDAYYSRRVGQKPQLAWRKWVRAARAVLAAMGDRTDRRESA